LIEQYFEGQYSLQQKSVLLTAIAMGARELSGLSTPQPINSHRRLDFPTKMLPPALHQKYIGPNDIPENQYQNQLEQAVSGVRDMMLRKSAERAEEYPALAREKKLRVGPGRIGR
jgi:telomere length regulation protein